MTMTRIFRVALLSAQFLLFAHLWGQSRVGELRLTVVDPAGLGLQGAVDLTCDANQIHRTYLTNASGYLEAKVLPFGVYRLQVSHAGFATYSGLIEVRSAVPAAVRIQLSIAANQTTVVVDDSATLIDPHRAGMTHRIGPDTMKQASIAAPGRSVVDLVDALPGWLLESNGVLHPRGSEYQTQYVVDGVPLTDNRSAAFAPEIEADDIESMTVFTASYPAEYGRKLGGVIEVSTARDMKPGFHGKAAASQGSFGRADGYLMTQYGWGKNNLGTSIQGALTDRYLDPPVIENFNNRATSGDFAVHYERDLTDYDRLRISLRHDQTVFQIPNEFVQQAAGQRQDRGSFETVGILSYQHIFSPSLLGDIRVMSRDISSRLSSNESSTPIIAAQQRGFREGYLKGSIAGHHGIHEFKAGMEIDYSSVHERFSDVITDPLQFDDGTPLSFSFSGRGLDREQSMYAQDLLRLGRLTLSAGLRWDHYQFVAEKHSFSPRLGVAWYWPRAEIVFHAAYDRIFQTPAAENLLLASSPTVFALNPQVLRLPVQPSNANFYELGMTKGLFGKVRLETSYYERIFDNYADDDLLLNTGVSFPIAFRKGKIYGAESKLEIPQWNRWSGYVSYSYLVGFGYTPVTGGLFLGNEATAALTNAGRFPVSQDQRNTVRARVRYQIAPRLWTAFGSSYGSGLPTEFEGSPQDAVQQFGQPVVDRINFDRGRVRPSLSFDIAAGLTLIKRDKVTMNVQSEVQNLNNRLNVINFAGLFSGTGIAPPRSYALRLVATF